MKKQYLLAVACFLSLFLSLFLSGCTYLVFQPTHVEYVNKERIEKHLKLSPTDIYFNSKGNQLHAWEFPTDSEPTALVLQFHGNGENLSSHFGSLVWLVKHQYKLITFDYSGYGKSEGFPSFPQVVADGKTFLEYFRNKYRNTPMIVYGQSLGALIASNSLKHINFKPDKIIFEGPVYSLNGSARYVLSKFLLTWPFQWLGHLLISHRYNFRKNLDSYPNVPHLIMHSKQDPIVSYRQSKKLMSSLKKRNIQSQLLLVEEPAHIQIGQIENGKYRQIILDFLNTPNQ